jgi:hypothetical protein
MLIMKILILTLILVLLFSGCAGIPDIFGTKKAEVKEQPPDVIVVQNINILPKPPINSGDQFSVSFEISNQEEKREVKYVGYEILDSGLCSLKSGNPTDIFTNFVSGQTEFIEWVFNAPSAESIGHLSTKCPIRFKTNYTFDSISEIEVDVISEEKYNQLQQSGGFKTFVPTLTIGRGPIKIYLSFGASLPIKTNTTLPIYITVEDKGTGLYSTVPTGKLIMKVPGEFNFSGCGERFNCSKQDNFYTCNNTQDIVMIKGKSPLFRCSFTTPVIPIEKIYLIEASLEYDYEITKEVEVEVKPILT